MLRSNSDVSATVASLSPPMQAKEVPALPCGEDWVYEFLWGGERVRAVKHDGGVHLLSRDGKDFTNRFPRVAASVAQLRASTAIIDGEILYIDQYTEAAHHFLEQTVDDISKVRIALLAYDLLCREQQDLRQHSLLCRRVMLASTVQATPIIVSPLLQEPAETALAMAARLGLRGIVAKRGGSAYRPNSLANDWVKVTLAPRTTADSRSPWSSSFTGDASTSTGDNTSLGAV